MIEFDDSEIDLGSSVPEAVLFDPHLEVKWDFEMDRILKIPRRDAYLAPDMSSYVRRPNATSVLWPFQNACLYDMTRVGANFAMGGVGAGKTLVGLLAPTVLQAVRTVYFTTATLRNQIIEEDHPRWAREFYVNPLGSLDSPANGCIFVLSYDAFSSAAQQEVLSRIRPDLVVGDEAHKLCDRTSVRTGRFLDYFRKENPGCRFVPMSGSFNKKSPRDFAHLIEICLRRHSPIPSPFRAYRTLVEWSEVVETPKKGFLPRQPGAFSYLGTPEEAASMARLDSTALKTARAVLRRRMVESPGVVATSESAVGTTLILNALYPEVPEAVKAAIRKLDREWVVGDDEIDEAPRFWAAARQLSMGFWYTWEWPGGKRDEEWIICKSAWSREVRTRLSGPRRKGMDSTALLEQAADRGEFRSQAYEDWKRVRNRPGPVTVPRWIDNFIIRETGEWLERHKKKGPSIIWYEHDVLGFEISRFLGLPLAGQGGINALRHAMQCQSSVVLSINAFSEGQNLQGVYSQNLYTCPPQNGRKWQQSLGRTHRPGQLADEVTADVFAHTRALKEGLWAGEENARYLQEMEGRQKLLYANRINWPRRVGTT